MFGWEAHIDTEMYWDKELKEDIVTGFRTKDEVNEIINKAYKIQKIKLSDGDDVLYKVNVGEVWLGTLKK
ncbi:hypothetical protein ACIGHG_12935 [Bacillus sp. NPDC077411]|uniref:Phage protein n=1 Tax=Bacillus bruguierae TaxID=3127667 RepID=A0ABU8FNA8_9BACI